MSAEGLAPVVPGPGPSPNHRLPAPSLEGRRVRLRPLERDDYDWLLSLSNLEDLGFRWRHLPGTVNPDSFGALVWQGVLAQFVITHAATGERLGLVLAYNAVPAHRTAYVALVLDPAVHRMGWPLEGFRLFMRYVFAAFDLRKVYAEAVDYNFDQYRAVARRHAREEGRLADHVYSNGAYHDVHILAFYRDDWG